MNHPLRSSTQFVSGVKELVRGQEREFLNELHPLVCRQNVTLDLEDTQRIDAAGLAALVTLYCESCKSGHRFAVANPSPQARKILALVRLDAILVSRNTERIPYCGTQLQETAA